MITAVRKFTYEVVLAADSLGDLDKATEILRRRLVKDLPAKNVKVEGGRYVRVLRQGYLK